MAEISCADLLSRGVDITLIPKCQQYVDNLLKAERSKYLADKFDSRPQIMTDHTDYSKLVPVTARVFKRPASDDTIYVFDRMPNRSGGGEFRYWLVA